MTRIEARRARKRICGTLPGRLTILVEGKEESGPPLLVPFRKQNADRLKAVTWACAARPASRQG